MLEVGCICTTVTNVERSNAAKQQSTKRTRGSILVASSAMMAWLTMLDILSAFLVFQEGAVSIGESNDLQRESASSRISVMKHRRGRS